MILWLDPARSASEHMRRDAALLARLDAAEPGAPEAEPVLRVFTFAPPGITLGTAQDPVRTLDLERCRADGVEWAVRPTGGRAIFHDDEWTYSFAARIDDPDWGGSLHAAYARVSALVHASLAALGVPARLVASHRHDADAAEAVSDPHRPSCFASTARHEIELDGRKLVGSAQRRTHAALLQQGSVLLGDGHLRLADYLAVDREARERARAALAANARPAGAWIADRDPARWADALARAAGPGVRRLSREDGAYLLTAGEPATYAPRP